MFPEISDEVEKEEKEEKDDGLFGLFWEMYPRKVGKGAARKSWKKIKEPGLTLDKIEAALTWQKKSEQWMKGHGEFIPLPATYLNQDRWMDEPQKAPAPAATRAQPMFATGPR